jgi:hypothetical protein
VSLGLLSEGLESSCIGRLVAARGHHPVEYTAQSTAHPLASDAVDAHADAGEGAAAEQAHQLIPLAQLQQAQRVCQVS